MNQKGPFERVIRRHFVSENERLVIQDSLSNDAWLRHGLAADFCAWRRAIPGPLECSPCLKLRWLQSLVEQVLFHAFQWVAWIRAPAIDQGGSVAFAGVRNGFRSDTIDSHHVVAVHGNQRQLVTLASDGKDSSAVNPLVAIRAAERDEKKGKVVAGCNCERLEPGRLPTPLAA